MIDISIVTPVYNEPRLESTLDSIIKQNGDFSLEIIVVDGQSTGETVSIIEEYRESIDILIQEPDEGIYDAMNKGIQQASGKIIGILNADDRYQDSNVLHDVVSQMEAENADICYGDLVYVDENDDIVRYWESGEYQPDRFYYGWMPPHPTLFIRQEVYDKYGIFDLDFSIAADCELMLRFLLKHSVSVAYVDRVLVRMAEGGKSNESISNIIISNIEVYRAWKKHELNGALMATILKPLRKINQFIDKPP